MKDGYGWFPKEGAIYMQEDNPVVKVVKYPDGTEETFYKNGDVNRVSTPRVDVATYETEQPAVNTTRINSSTHEDDSKVNLTKLVNNKNDEESKKPSPIKRIEGEESIPLSSKRIKTDFKKLENGEVVLPKKTSFSPAYDRSVSDQLEELQIEYSKLLISFINYKNSIEKLNEIDELKKTLDEKLKDEEELINKKFNAEEHLVKVAEKIKEEYDGVKDLKKLLEDLFK